MRNYKIQLTFEMHHRYLGWSVRMDLQRAIRLIIFNKGDALKPSFLKYAFCIGPTRCYAYIYSLIFRPYSQKLKLIPAPKQ